MVILSKTYTQRQLLALDIEALSGIYFLSIESDNQITKLLLIKKE